MSSALGWSAGSSPHTRGALEALSGEGGPGGDHPRIRGEHHHPSRCVALETWIIPAYAGSTEFSKALVDYFGGSSPHTRGAR